MAYESLLNTAAILSAAPTSSTLTNGYSATAFFNLSGTTLGAQLKDIVLVVNLQSSPTVSKTLSADATVTATLTSASCSNQVYTGYIVNSTWSATSATATLGWNSPNMGTTAISFSANKSTTVLDSTQPAVMDNWFYFTSVPEPAQNRAVRTTLGQARLVSYLG